MYQNKKILAVIPARGGSKRLPRKNILELAGKPLIEWTISAAKESQHIDKVVVTSDDKDILALSEKNNINTIVRPASLASDKASTVDVVLHSIENMNDEYDYIVLLQPTSPLRAAQHIDAAIVEMFEKNAESVVSVTKTEHSPLWSNVLPEDRPMNNFFGSDIEGVRSQDLVPYYRLNGAIYIVNTNKFIDAKRFVSNMSFAYIMPAENSVDIDTRFDFICAEALLSCNI